MIRYILKLSLLSLSFLFMAACSHTGLDQEKVRTYKHLGFAADQGNVDFSEYKQQGYKKIVNLREVGEDGYTQEQLESERKQAEELGLEYVNVPFSREVIEQRSVSEKLMYDIEKAVAPSSGVKTLVHCSSSARASAWFAWHLHQKHGLHLDESLQKAAEVGPGTADAENALYAVELLLRSTGSRD